MPRSIARVTTEKPSAYLRQFCKHFSHKASDDFTVKFDDLSGLLRYRETGAAEQVLRLSAMSGGDLVLTAECDDPRGLEELQGWAGDHLVRFGRRDALVVDWQPV